MVSAVITTHNRVNLLRRAIQSVLSQTYKDIELIVVSDGSTDGTDEFMKQYEGDNNINFISYHPGRGGNYARNTGIKSAKGEYIAFLDDDDEWLPTKIERQLIVMESNPEIGLVYTGSNIIYVNENVNYSFVPSLEGDLSKLILIDNFIGSTTTVMIKKTILTYSGLFDEELMARQDFDLWIRVCQYCRVGVVSQTMANYYNYRSTNQISSNTEKYEKAYDYIETKYRELFSRLTSDERKIYEKNKLFLLGNRAKRNNNSRLARKYYRSLLMKGLDMKAIIAYILSYISYSLILKLKRIL